MTNKSTSFYASYGSRRALAVASRHGINRSALIDALLRSWAAGEIAVDGVPRLPTGGPRAPDTVTRDG